MQAVVGKNKLTCKITVKKAAKANAPAGANKQDVAALKALIAEQRGRGATVSEDMSSDQYEWKDGRLVTIQWKDTNLTGNISFSALTALTELDCSENRMSSLDVSKNVNLTRLCCYKNQLSSLDVSKNVNLTGLGCSDNQLSSLDVSKNVNLMKLYCHRNQLSRLDLTANSKLKTLSCDETVTLTGYNPTNAPAGANEQDVEALVALIMEQREGGATVSKNMSSDQYEWKDGRLVTISWSKKGLTGDISFSAFTALTKLDCSDNQLKSLDVSGNVNLKELDCSGNSLLDLSNNTKLKDWSYSGNTTVIDPDDWDWD